jgi:transposase
MHHYDGKRPHHICETLRLSLSIVKRVLQRFKNDMPLLPVLPETRRKKRREKELNGRELSALVDLIRNNATLYLDELRDAVRRKTGTYVKGAPGASSLELPIVRRHALRKI